MWMRMIRSHGLTPQKLKTVVEGYRREDLPRVDEAPGFLGIALGQNVDSGSVGSVTFWESEQAMLDTDRYSAEARERALVQYETSSSSMVVEAFEVTYTRLLRPLAGTALPWMRFVRFLDMDADTLQSAVDSYREDAERHIGETTGVEGIAIGVNISERKVAVLSGWTSQEAMRSAERLSQQTRDRAASAARTRPPLVDRYEIAVSSRLDRLSGVAVPTA